MGRDRYSRADQARYNAYIHSPAWATRKRRAIALAGHRCQYEELDEFGGFLRCPRGRYLCVHHLTYDRLGCEADEDLQVLCWFHHALEHLMWAGCAGCRGRVFADDRAAREWLHDFAAGERFYIDLGPVNWRRVPGKFLIESVAPTMCLACDPAQHGCADS